MAEIEARVRTREACEYLKCSRSSVLRWIRDGVLTSEKDAKGENWFSVAELERVRPILGQEGAEVPREADPLEAAARVISQQGEFVKTLLDHERRMFDSVLDRADRVLNLLATENEHMRSKHLELLQVIERALSLESEREIARLDFGRKVERQEKGLELAGTVVQHVVQQIKTSGVAKELVELVRSLSEEQVGLLGTLGLEPEQVRMIQGLRKPQAPALEAPKEKQ